MLSGAVAQSTSARARQKFTRMSLPPLTPDQQVKPPHFELRISLIYAALFIPAGTHLPYFPLWLEGAGFGAGDIAVILSAPMFVRVVTTPFICAFADRASDRANVLIAMVAATLLLSFGYFLAPAYATVLAVSLAIVIFWTPHGPLTDSLALSGVRRYGSDYARMRIWGSIAFLSANFGAGAILARTGTGAVPVMISCGLAATLIVTLAAPRLGRPRLASPLSAVAMQVAAPSLFAPAFVYVVAGAGIVNGSHGFLYGFVSIYWQSLGISETLVGLLWAWAVLAEVCMFMVFTRVFGRVSPPMLIVLAGLAAAVRWLAFPLIWPAGLGVPGFFVVQTLHAISTGLILLGVQKVIAGAVPEERTGAAQGIAFFANGFAMAAVTLLSGPLYEAFGADGFFAMAGVAGLGLCLIGFGLRSAPEGRRGR